MDCDRVFFTLSGAPFPVGLTDDAELERHLLRCDGCRRFAEALRPCESLFHESLPAAERRTLPRYRTEISPAVATSPGEEQRSTKRRSAGRAPRPPETGWPTPQGDQRQQAGQRGAWRSDLEVWAPDCQVASFSIIPRSRASRLWDVASLTLMIGAVMVGGWCLGLLAK